MESDIGYSFRIHGKDHDGAMTQRCEQRQALAFTSQSVVEGLTVNHHFDTLFCEIVVIQELGQDRTSRLKRPSVIPA